MQPTGRLGNAQRWHVANRDGGYPPANSGCRVGSLFERGKMSFEALRRALDEDENGTEALKRIRKLFRMAPLGKPPTDRQIIDALRGDRLATMEEIVAAKVDQNRFVEEPPALPLNGDPIIRSLQRKLGINS